MAYLDSASLHAYPLDHSPRSSLPPATTLFPKGPEWTRRYQKNLTRDHLDNRFMYKDQGPPMYRLLGHHYNMYATPNKTDYSTSCRSYNYEPRQHNAPGYRNQAVAFPNGPPPAQVALLDQIISKRKLTPQTARIEVPNQKTTSYKAYDQYRYLPGPPPAHVIYGSCQAWEKRAVLSDC